jgi:4-amino-4-deoxy-L-arabinose transferase-like glycosyltransferase
MKHKWLLVVFILAVAIFFRLQNLSVAPPGFNAITSLNGNVPLLYRLYSALAGVLTILGLYFLACRLFNWKIAAAASYLMAIAFWHVNFSRSGMGIIVAPLLLVWGLYFFWKALSSIKIWNFAISGILLGLGLYVSNSFWIIFVALLLALLAYWSAIAKDFDHEKYTHVRNRVLAGLALFIIFLVLVATPMIARFAYTVPLNMIGGNSVFAAEPPINTFGNNIAKVLEMFNFAGDNDWRYNMAGQPILFWPMGVLFALGFLRSIIKFFSSIRKRGHFATIPTLLLSWFFVGLIPQLFYKTGVPDSLSALIVAPAVFIFTGEGLWWIIDKLGDWWQVRDVHEFRIHHHWMKESSIMAIFALIVLLTSFTFVEYDKYFNKWAKNPNVIKVFEKFAP